MSIESLTTMQRENHVHSRQVIPQQYIHDLAGAIFKMIF